MPCLNLQLRKFQNYILYIRNKHSLQSKQSLLIKKLKDTLMYEKKNHSSLKAILDAILYQGSLIKCSQITMSHFEPFYAWNNLNFMQ